MAVYRTWPKPPDGAIHLIGDTHFGSLSMTANRKALWAADQRAANLMLPDTLLHVIVGDFVDHGLTTEDNEAVAFMNAQVGAGNWISAVGNHDVFTPRGVNAAATAWGMPSANYVKDIPGVCRLVVAAPDDGIENDGYTMKPFTSTRINWIAEQCAAAPGGVPAFIVCHWSLYDTVGPAAGSDTSSTTPGFYAYIDADIEEMLADTPNAKAWLSGHIHCPLPAPGLVSSVAVGGHRLAAINGCAMSYTGNVSDNLSSQQPSLYLTVTDGRVDVRFRDHGANSWTVAGPDRTSVWSVTL